MSENVHWPGSTVSAPATTAEEEAEYFAVSTPKFIVMSIFSWGLYELYWAYKQWSVIKRKTGSDMMPFWRAFFAGLWGFSLFGKIKDAAQRRAVSADWSPGWLGFAYLMMLSVWRLPDPWWLLGLLSFLPMLPAVHAVGQLNKGPSHLSNDKYTGANIAGIVVGALILALVLVRMTIDVDVAPTEPALPNRAALTAPLHG